MYDRAVTRMSTQRNHKIKYQKINFPTNTNSPLQIGQLEVKGYPWKGKDKSKSYLTEAEEEKDRQ